MTNPIGDRSFIPTVRTDPVEARRDVQPTKGTQGETPTEAAAFTAALAAPAEMQRQDTVQVDQALAASIAGIVSTHILREIEKIKPKDTERRVEATLDSAGAGTSGSRPGQQSRDQNPDEQERDDSDGEPFAQAVTGVARNSGVHRGESLVTFPGTDVQITETALRALQESELDQTAQQEVVRRAAHRQRIEEGIRGLSAAQQRQILAGHGYD